MKQTGNNRSGVRFVVASLVVAASSFSFLACEDPLGLVNDGEPFLDEMYSFDVEQDVQYGSAPDENGVEEALLLDLFKPRGDGDGPRPAVIWLHGGSFRMGKKGEMTEFARSMARRGYVSATANYRLREGADFDYTDPDDALAEEVKRDAQHDVQAATRWLRANAEELRLDAGKIYLAGFSAGGTAALRAAAWPDDAGSSGNPGESSEVSAVVAISAYLVSGALDQVGPSLLIHGDDDHKISIETIEEPCRSLATCELVTIPGGRHNLISSENPELRDEILAETARYLHARVNGS